MTAQQGKKRLIQRINSDKDRLRYELEAVGVDPYAYRLIDKGLAFNIKVSDLSCGAANILKQEAIASGIDAAVAKGTVNCSISNSDALILGHVNGIKKLIKRLEKQPFGLAGVADEIRRICITPHSPELILKDRVFDLSTPLIMGILNTTPDSFSDGGRFQSNTQVDTSLASYESTGVDIVDIGGESSRPGAQQISASEEIQRIEYAVKQAVKMGFTVSVDTCKSEVAEFALSQGVHLINDISGLTSDIAIADLCAQAGAGICLMHMKGTPESMQDQPTYGDLMGEISCFFQNAIEVALSSGMSRNQLMIDPGFGFGKTLQDNYYILKHIDEFQVFGLPILVGVSRKSMIGKVTGEPADERMVSSKVIEALALEKGAHIVRTHDVEEAIEMRKLLQYYKTGDL